jgi:hypothetical protein
MVIFSIVLLFSWGAVTETIARRYPCMVGEKDFE